MSAFPSFFNVAYAIANNVKSDAAKVCWGVDRKAFPRLPYLSSGTASVLRFFPNQPQHAGQFARINLKRRVHNVFTKSDI